MLVQIRVCCDFTGNSERTGPLGGEQALNRAKAGQWYDWVYRRVRDNEPYDKLVAGIALAVGRRPEQPFAEYCEEMSSYFRKDSPADFASRPTMPYFWTRRTLGKPEEQALSFAWEGANTLVKNGVAQPVKFLVGATDTVVGTAATASKLVLQGTRLGTVSLLDATSVSVARLMDNPAEAVRQAVTGLGDAGRELLAGVGESAGRLRGVAAGLVDDLRHTLLASEASVRAGEWPAAVNQLTLEASAVMLGSSSWGTATDGSRRSLAAGKTRRVRACRGCTGFTSVEAA